MQQAFRSIFGAREVSACLAGLADGFVEPDIDIPRNGHCSFIVGVPHDQHDLRHALPLLLEVLRNCMRLRRRRTELMSRAVGINTNKVDRT
jgi:urea transport system permease protein